jgi:hypothetical protein
MNIKGIIIPLTEEEFDERVTAAVKRAFENFSSFKEEVNYLKGCQERIMFFLPMVIILNFGIIFCHGHWNTRMEITTKNIVKNQEFMNVKSAGLKNY